MDPTFSVVESLDCYSSPGDVNEDGEINILDITPTINFILGCYIFTECEFYLSDVNEDGVVNIMDLIVIVYIILGN